jgi:cell division protein FtsN
VAAALKRFLLGSALVGVGLVLGIVIGTLWDLPELLLRRLQEAPRTISLTPPEPVAAAEPLSAFRELQAKTRRAPAPPRAAPARPKPATPAPAAAPPAPERRVVPAPSPRPPSAKDRALADVAARAAKRSAPDREVVIQVASYADRRAAEALVTRLRREGFDSYLSDARPGGDVRYRVRVRPRAGLGAPELAGKLQSSGFNTWITSE